MVRIGSGSVEQLGAEVGEGRPGDEDGRDDSEDAEDGQGECQVAAFDGIHHGGLSFHGVLLFEFMCAMFWC